MSIYCGECGGRGYLAGLASLKCERCKSTGLAPVTTVIHAHKEGGHWHARWFSGRADDGGSRPNIGTLIIGEKEWTEFAESLGDGIQVVIDE